MALVKMMGGWDVHGDLQDPDAVRAFFDFAAIWKPKIRVCGGDLWNFVPLRKGASEDERRQSMRKDIKAGKDWFNRFKPTLFLRGNHDQRLWDLAANGVGPAADLAYEGVGEIERMVEHHKCLMLPYDKRDGVFTMGKLKLLHGFHCGVNAARQTALIYGSALFGHVHTIDEHSIPGLERRVARSVGCLCKLSMDYNSREPNSLRQAHGFAYGFVNDKTGNYHVFQAESVGGKWLLPSDFIELK